MSIFRCGVLFWTFNRIKSERIARNLIMISVYKSNAEPVNEIKHRHAEPGRPPF
jgi:hypothetical protein